MSKKKIMLEVINDDAITYESDILVLKYAQRLYGLDRAIVSIFEQDGSSVQNNLPKSGEYVVVDTPEDLKAPSYFFASP